MENGKVIVFGEVLFDIFPDGKRLGGAPFNFAIHLHQLGVPVYFVSRIGDDSLGSEIRNFTIKNEFPLDGVQVDRQHSTGEVRIRFSKNGCHSFEILPHRAWDYIEWNTGIDAILNGRVSMVYFGTLSQRQETSRQCLLRILKQASGKAPIFMDLNLRPPFYHRDLLDCSLNYCNILKANEEEMFELKEIFHWRGSRVVPAIVQRIWEEYPIEYLFVTKGKNGSALYRRGKRTPCVQESKEPEPFRDSVGAGDAFSAMLAFGLLNHWKDQKVLAEASLFASRVCSITGAIPENREFYQRVS